VSVTEAELAAAIEKYKQGGGTVKRERPAADDDERETTADKQVARIFTAEEIAAFEAQAEHWVKNRAELGQHLVRQALVFMQMQEEISKNPGKGRSAMTNQRAATNIWFDLAEKALEILGKEAEAKK
jgi:hypothetical protein